MARMSAGHAVAESLVQLGVKNVMGMVGSCMIEILDGMYERKDDLHFLTVRHEQSAALMAGRLRPHDRQARRLHGDQRPGRYESRHRRRQREDGPEPRSSSSLAPP